MKNYVYCKTKDTSTGLYNNDVGDIYHSKYGALKESIEKFIIPSGIIDFVKDNKQVKLLDICYGIGYNTKAAMYFSQKTNSKIKMHIDALENDEELIFISPLIKDCIPSLDLKIFLMSQIKKNNSAYFQKINKITHEIDKYEENFYSPYIRSFLQKYDLLDIINAPVDENNSFLHNIYYQYISTSIKNGHKTSLFKDFSFNYHCDDARKSLLKLDNEYDFVFLDAFTPIKDPTLWSFDFLKLIKSHMKKNSILVTYSNSTPVRSAFLELGFNLGKILINKKQFGTVASLNKKLLKFPLDEFDIGLTKTMGGIIYKDKLLNLSKEEIKFNRETDKANSARMSTSQYKKKYANV